MKRIVVYSAVVGEAEAVQKINIYIYIYIIKNILFFTKQRKFHQVKVTSPFLLNKIMATSTTKQLRKTRYTSTIKQLRKARFTTNCRTAGASLRQS